MGDDSTSGDVHRQDPRLAARYQAWKRTCLIFGVITSVLIIVFIVAVAIGLAVGTPYEFPVRLRLADTGTHPVRVVIVSQTGQTLAVAGLIIACISALGTLLSGLATFMTARAMARQGVPAPAPKTGAKPNRPRTRKVP